MVMVKALPWIINKHICGLTMRMLVDMLEKIMTASQISKAKELSEEWLSKHYKK